MNSSVIYKMVGMRNKVQKNYKMDDNQEPYWLCFKRKYDHF